ncbi:helix-turn-helix domain-containing protein [Methylovirgula sp. 4M-Z18]|uniref:helix-turn-helix domain-containing protein n=1 Tax=Methylovirgula sp. 4M-Z18 TaxID=2293567 RepID=UPI001FE0A711|nr:XRE family transcriptional regulator [Methylovirgula sp. 4M-Z18]
MEQRLAHRLKALRLERGLTLEALAQRSGVSRSMISLIERGESSPTAQVLDRLATSFGIALATLFIEEPRAGASPLARRADQPEWRDPATGYVRRVLSPPDVAVPFTLVEITLPAGARVTYDNDPGNVIAEEQIWLLDGQLELTAGTKTHRLQSGDCLVLRVDGPNAFHNPGREAARYLLAVTARGRNANGRDMA